MQKYEESFEQPILTKESGNIAESKSINDDLPSNYMTSNMHRNAFSSVRISTTPGSYAPIAFEQHEFGNWNPVSLPTTTEIISWFYLYGAHGQLRNYTMLKENDVYRLCLDSGATQTVLREKQFQCYKKEYNLHVEPTKSASSFRFAAMNYQSMGMFYAIIPKLNVTHVYIKTHIVLINEHIRWCWYIHGPRSIIRLWNSLTYYWKAKWKIQLHYLGGHVYIERYQKDKCN